jgi:hypothetical protein
MFDVDRSGDFGDFPATNYRDYVMPGLGQSQTDSPRDKPIRADYRDPH